MKQYDLFLNSLKSSATKRAYKTFFKKYQEFMGSNDLFYGNNTKLIEEKIIEFIVSLKERGLSHLAIRNYVFCVISFYKINDIVLNTTKISKFLPEYKKMKKDRAYEHEEIQKLLDFADERLRAVILLLASTGMRIGATPDLRVRNLQDTKITIYEGTRDEYTTFITPECKEAIDSYLDMRRRYGEEINEDSYLIREQFDIRKPSEQEPKQTVANTLYGKLRDLSNRSGVRDKTLPICHGFRKFFSSQLVEADVNTEKRWLLEGHNLKANDASYVKVSEKLLFQEYQKAINNLTINEENRLKIKVQRLEGDSNEIQNLKRQINDNTAILNKFTKMLELGYVRDTVTPVGSEEMKRQKREIKEISKDLQKKGIKAAQYFDSDFG